MTDAVTDVLDRFERARGEEADELWAGRVVLALTLRDVSSARIRQALAGAVELVESSGEGAEELFGSPETWARDRIEEWVEEGVAYHDADTFEDLNTLASVTGITATIISILVVIMHTVRGQWTIPYTIGWLVFPLLAAATTVGTLTAWERLLGRRPWPVAVAGAGAVFALGVALTTTAMLMPGGELGRAGLGWLFLQPLVLAGLTWAASRFIPERPARPSRQPPPLDAVDSDALWMRQAEAALRRRGDLRGSEVRAILDDAREHAARSGTLLVEEFGVPRTYADTFPRREGLLLVRRAVVATAGVALFAWFLVDATSSLWLWAGLALWVVLAAQAWWRVWRHRRQAPTRRTHGR